MKRPVVLPDAHRFQPRAISGVYFVRMITTGTASRRTYTQTSRVLVLR